MAQIGNTHQDVERRGRRGIRGHREVKQIGKGDKLTWNNSQAGQDRADADGVEAVLKIHPGHC